MRHNTVKELLGDELESVTVGPCICNFHQHKIDINDCIVDCSSFRSNTMNNSNSTDWESKLTGSRPVVYVEFEPGTTQITSILWSELDSNSGLLDFNWGSSNAVSKMKQSIPSIQKYFYFLLAIKFVEFYWTSLLVRNVYRVFEWCTLPLPGSNWCYSIKAPHFLYKLLFKLKSCWFTESSLIPYDTSWLSLILTSKHKTLVYEILDHYQIFVLEHRIIVNKHQVSNSATLRDYENYSLFPP